LGMLCADIGNTSRGIVIVEFQHKKNPDKVSKGERCWREISREGGFLGEGGGEKRRDLGFENQGAEVFLSRGDGLPEKNGEEWGGWEGRKKHVTKP